MKLTRSSILVSAALLVITSGCRKAIQALTAEPTSQTQGAATAAPDGEDQARGVDPAEAADDKLGDKLQTYLAGCLNGSARRMFSESVDRYSQEVDEKEGPQSGQRPSLYKVDLSDVETCIADAAKAKAMTPPLPELEGAAQAFAAALKAAGPVVNEAEKYYDQKDYEDDKLAKGKALHPQLIAHFQKVTSLSIAMGEAFSKLKDPLDGRELARLAVKGPRFAYLTKKSILGAKHYISASRATSVEQFFALPVDKLQADVDALSKDADELQALVDAKAKELEGTSNVDSYTRELTDFLKEAKEVTRRVRDQRKFSSTEEQRLGTSAGWMTSGSPDSLEHEHHELVNSYNRLQF